jgi:hypothetical protein
MLPNKIPEYFSANAFVVAGVHEPFASFLDEHVTGRFFHPGDREALFDILCRLIDDPSKYRSGRDNRSVAQGHFSTDVFRREINLLWDDLADVDSS